LRKRPNDRGGGSNPAQGGDSQDRFRRGPGVVTGPGLDKARTSRVAADKSGLALLFVSAAAALLAFTTPAWSGQHRPGQTGIQDRLGKMVEPPGLDPALPLSPASPRAVDLSNTRSDVHQPIRFRRESDCISCHPERKKDNLHVFRHGIDCRACHGEEPLAAIDSHESTLARPGKRIMACSACHPGAGRSLTEYAVHEPHPWDKAAIRDFPELARSFRLAGLLGGSGLGLLVLLTLAWALRDLAGRLGERFMGRRKERE